MPTYINLDKCEKIMDEINNRIDNGELRYDIWNDIIKRENLCKEEINRISNIGKISCQCPSELCASARTYYPYAKENE